MQLSQLNHRPQAPEPDISTVPQPGPARRQHGRRVLLTFVVVLLAIVAATFIIRHLYYHSLGPVSSSAQATIIEVPSGSTSRQIGQKLAANHLIHSIWVFDWYVHSTEQTDNFKAGTYALAPNQSLPNIVSTLTKGKVATKLVTIIPGRRIDQVRADLINDGFSVASVDAALKPNQYRDLPVMSFVPTSATTLEGLLYPDSFQRNADTDPAVIIRESLREMGDHLTASLQQSYAAKGLSVYQGLTLASIVEKEVSKPADRAQAAQVFLSRLSQGMNLGSDVTALYGAIAAGQAPALSYDSPYNTLQHKGLPPGPISVVSSSSLQAVANPASTNWLYFVAGDNGTTYFETTFDQHQADAAQYCHKFCTSTPN